MQIDLDTINTLISKPIWPFFRISAVVMTMPIIGATHVLQRVKLAISLFLTIILAPWVAPKNPPELISFWGYLMVLREVIIGLSIGLITQIFFQIFVMGGQIAAMQMGLGFASLNDPQNNSDVPVISQFYLMMVTLMFVAVDGHLLVLQALSDSYKVIPIEQTGALRIDIWALVLWGKWIFLGGLKMVLPMLFAILIVNMVFGVMARAAPQLSIFAVGFPLTLCFGVTLLMLTLPTIMSHFEAGFEQMIATLNGVINGE